VPPGEFAEYRIVRQLGVGAMGKVFLAHDIVLDRPVALKFLGSAHLSGVARERFVLEARALARLNHPNVVGVFRVGEVETRPYLVSEFVRGKSLDKLPRPAAWMTVLNQSVDLSRGLAAAHRAGVLHRDIKPANAIMTESGEVKLLDFGLAKLIDKEAVIGESARDSQMDLPLPAQFAQFQRAAMAAPVKEDSGDMDPYDPYRDPLLPMPPSIPSLLPGNSWVVHRDPKPDKSDHALTGSGALMGTPVYLAPELWDGGEASMRSDIYAFGTMMFELLVGRTPHRGNTIDDIADSIVYTDAIPVGALVADIDPRFAAIVNRCLRRDPKERYLNADDLRRELERLIAQLGTPEEIPKGNPYPGLKPFEAAQRALFYGRDAEVRDILERLRGDTFLAIAANAGIGKTSLCVAGVGPAVASGALGRGRTWQVTTMVPGPHPELSLAAALAPIAGVAVAAAENALRTGDEAQLDRLRHSVFRALGAGQGWLLIIDPIEDFVLSPHTEEVKRCSEFIAQMLAGGGNALRVIGSMRIDYLTRVATLPGLGDRVAQSIYVLPPMSADGMHEAIVGPAKQLKIGFDPASLVDDLIEAQQSGTGLAIVQFALSELWEHREYEDVLTAAVLAKLGGVDGALMRHADMVFDTLPEQEHGHARDILLALVGGDREKIARSGTELNADQPGVQRALQALIKGRLVSARMSEANVYYEIIHGVLISKWQRFINWIDDDGDRRIVRRRIELAAADWLRLKKSPSALWLDRRLGESSIAQPERLSSDALEFLRKSRIAYRRRKRIQWTLGIGIPLLILTTFLVVRQRIQAAVNARDAEVARERAEKVAAFVEQSHAVSKNASTVAAVAVERAAAMKLFDARSNAEAEIKWRDVLTHSQALDAMFAKATLPLERAIFADPTRDDVRAELSALLDQRAHLADLFYNKDRKEELLERLELYDSGGALFAAWHAPATLTFDVSPASTTFSISTITPVDGRRVEGPPRPLDKSSSVPPGNYIVFAKAAGYSDVRYPILLQPGEQLTIPLKMLPSEQVPPGFVYIPEGRFLVGTIEESARTSFFYSVPMHEVRTGGYLIERFEVTFGQWIEFLNSLSDGEQQQFRPRSDGSSIMAGWSELRRTGSNSWALTSRPVDHTYQASMEQPLIYLDRKQHQVQNWLNMPVYAVSINDAERYAKWLHVTDRISFGRPCNELEWERAARGADDRIFPHGDVLRTSDANFDETYGKEPNAFGVDEVGSWPSSRSPFGVDDMAGNVFEWTTISHTNEPKLAALRGGAYFYGGLTEWIVNRNTVYRASRNGQGGVRMCADLAK
jgi:eukaryotic-like serine/threonine-protein kinase